MKYRLDYVTNSSSSSYICDVCHADFSGYDASLEDAEMYQCVNGHTVCESHVKFSEEYELDIIKKFLDERFDFDYYLKREYFRGKFGWTKDEIIKHILEDEDLQEEFKNEYMEMRYNLPSKLCPVCQFEATIGDDTTAYLLKKLGMSENDLKKELKENFCTYAEFKGSLK